MAGTDYVVNPLDPTSPLDTNVARKGAAEFRALKQRVNNIALGAVGNQGQPRQTVLQGLLTAAGVPSLLALSATVFGVDLKATVLPCYLAFAAGFGSTGSIDAIEQATADQIAYWAALAPSNLTYLGFTRISAGITTPFQTLAPPQYGDSYDQSKQSVLQFAGAAGSVTFLDDFGNTWAANGAAKIQTNSFKFGTGGLGGGGAGNSTVAGVDFIRCSNFPTLGQLGWSIRGWVNPSTLPGVGVSLPVAGVTNSIGLGAVILINNAAGVIKFSYSLSSTGAGADIATAVQGTTTPVIGIYYFVELTYDSNAGTYRLYVNGVQESTTVNANKVCGTSQAAIAFVIAFGSGLNGYFDKWEILPYCQHPAGTLYAVPAAAPNIANVGYASDWFDTQQYLMKTPSAPSVAAGTNPTFTNNIKLYVGQGITSAAAVTSVTTYAYNRRYTSPQTAIAAVNTGVSFAHLLGIPAELLRFQTLLINQTSEFGYQTGDTAEYQTSGQLRPTSLKGDRITAILTNSAAFPSVVNKSTGAAANISQFNWKSIVTVEGRF